MELSAVVRDELLRVLSHEQHLANVRFGLRVAFEAVLVAHLTFAYLAIPSQALETFRFELVVQELGGAYLGFGHLSREMKNGAYTMSMNR